MRKTIFLLMISMYTGTIFCSGKEFEVKAQTGGPQPVIITVTNNNHSHPTNTFTPSNSNTMSPNIQTTSNTTSAANLSSQMNNTSNNVNSASSFTVSINANTVKSKKKQRMRQQQDLLNKALLDGVQSLASHWYLCLGALAAGTYGYLWYRLYQGKKLLKKKGTWMRWKNNLSIEELTEASGKTMELDLITLIQKKYISLKDPNDFIIPLVRFSRALNKEYKDLRAFMVLAQAVQSCYMGRLFGIYPEHTSTAQKRRDRLLFIRNTFLSWSADDRIKQHMQHYLEKKRPQSFWASLSQTAYKSLHKATMLLSPLFKRNPCLKPETPLAQATQS